MKLTIDIGLDDLLIEETEYDYEEGYDKTTYKYANEDELRDIVKEKVKEAISYKLSYHSRDFLGIVKNVVEDSKDEIIASVIKEVSTKIINQKAIKDFKKSLDNN